MDNVKIIKVQGLWLVRNHGKTSNWYSPPRLKLSEFEPEAIIKETVNKIREQYDSPIEIYFLQEGYRFGIVARVVDTFACMEVPWTCIKSNDKEIAGIVTTNCF